MKTNNQLRTSLKEHLGCTRDETVDFVWNQLASKNIKLDNNNRSVVLNEGKKLYDELLKDW